MLKKFLLMSLVFLMIFGNGVFAAEEEDPVPKFKEMRITNLHINFMTYGNGKYVAVGDNGFIATSENGVDWVQQSSPMNKKLMHVIYDGDPKRFVAVGYNREIITSDDGETWSIVSNTFNNFQTNTVIYDNSNSRFIIIGNELSSPWRNTVSISTNNGHSFNHTIYSNTMGLFYDFLLFNNILVAASWGNDEYSHNRNGAIRTAPISNVTSWTNRYGNFGSLYSLATNDNRSIIVAVGISGNIATSTNGTSWTKRNSGVTSTLRQVTFHEGYFYATGDGGVFLRSKDGITWERLENLNYDANRIYSLNGDLFISGNNGLIKIEFYNGVNDVTFDVTDTTATFSWNMIDNGIQSNTNIFLNGELVKQTTERTYTHTGLDPLTEYTFTFVSDDGRPVEVKVKTKESQVEVRNLKALVVTHERVNLVWERPIYDDFEKVVIYRKTLGETSYFKNFMNVAYADGYTPLFETNGTTFNDLTVKEKTKYEYLLTSKDVNGNESKGVTIQVTTKEEPAPEMGGVDSGENDNGDYIYKWTSPTKGQVKILVGGVEYATVPASNKQIVIPKADMKYTLLGNPDVRLVAISESGKEGRPVNPNIPFSGTQIPLKVDDLLTTSMSLIWILAPFILLVLAIIYAKKIIQVIRKSVETRRSARQGGVNNERRS